MISATLNTLATLPLQHHTELGLLMSGLCLILGALTVLVYQQVQEVRTTRGYRFRKASWIAYLVAAKGVECAYSMDDYLADILQ